MVTVVMEQGAGGMNNNTGTLQPAKETEIHNIPLVC
jgi:hypothetical protein